MRLHRLIPFVVLLALPTLAASGAPQTKKTVAVLRFDNNTGEERYDNLGRALSAMLISDLSVVEEIQLIERERIEDILNELKLQQSGYADPSSAVDLGMIAGAQFVVTGAFVTMDPDIQLDTRVANVETAEIVKTADVTGERDDLFVLQDRLAEELIEGLALVLTEEDRERLREQQEANRLGDMETALAFAEVLCLLDYGAYAEAFDQIQRVQRDAPRSSLVRGTLEHLKDKVEDEGKNQLVERAENALGGLLGRNRAPQREERQRRPAACG